MPAFERITKLFHAASPLRLELSVKGTTVTGVRITLAARAITVTVVAPGGTVTTGFDVASGKNCE